MSPDRAGRRRFLLGTAAGAAGTLAGARALVAPASRAAAAARAAATGPSPHVLRYYRTAAY
jgi:hypothetical protein